MVKTLKWWINDFYGKLNIIGKIIFFPLFAAGLIFYSFVYLIRFLLVDLWMLLYYKCSTKMTVKEILEEVEWFWR